MSKRKRFRRVKVSNMGYVPGKRQQMFRAHEKKQKTAHGSSTTGGKAEQNMNNAVSASYDTGKKEEMQA